MENYNRLKLVGKGSFGFAVLVEDVHNHKYYLLKAVDISMMSQQQRAQAAEEVKALKALKHPFVVKYRESFVHNRRYLCIVMHYCKYGDLAKLIKARREQRQLLEEQQILRWFVQVALALKHIHENQIKD